VRVRLSCVSRYQQQYRTHQQQQLKNRGRSRTQLICHSTSAAMTAAHEPTIHYLDSVLSEEEKRCDYNHQWRNISISRSGRFRSKSKKRDTVDGKLFSAGLGSPRDNEKVRSFRLLRILIIASVNFIRPIMRVMHIVNISDWQYALMVWLMCRS